MKKTKIICIGWHKTGTTTLGDALLELGYSVLGARLDLADSLIQGDVETTLRVATPYEALQDVPWNALYKELDKTFPGSKFILTVRDERKWLQSGSKHFGTGYSKMREWLYGVGVLEGNEQRYLDRYRQHYRDVQSYFKDRPGDLLIMDLSKGDGWEKLCPFLGCPVPAKKFPHSNKGKHSYTLTDKVLDALKRMTPMPLRHLRISVLRLFGVPDPRHRFNNRQQNEQVRSLRQEADK